MLRITDLHPYTSRPDEPIRDVLRRIDSSPYLFQVVVDETGRILGTVTDGDVRRAILHGATLDSPASGCMQVAPKIGRLDDPRGNADLMQRLGSRVPFLPVVDERGVLCEIHYGLREEQRVAAALVMAGGPGTRLGERTRDVPKPLLPVAGRPILDHVLDKIEAVGVAHIFVSVHYLADKIEDFLANRRNRAEIAILKESQRLGTAGALWRIDGTKLAGPLLVINGDVITNVDFRALHEFHGRHGLDGTVCVARHEVQIPFGVVRQDGEGMFEGIDEKPLLQHFVAAGVYYLSAEFLALAPREQFIDMPELLNRGKQAGLKIGLFPIHEYWADVGRPADLDAADAAHRSGAPAPRESV